ncbi:MAG TPA: DMT family transporter [Ktedonobacterales bacterium]|nr:DMT family transporter [Ktedonobacterales bacterium]
MPLVEQGSLDDAGAMTPAQAPLTDASGQSSPGMQAAQVASRRVKAPAVPPTVLAILSMLSVQVGAALATRLFPALGPGGVVFLRMAFGAVALLLVWRPRRQALRTYGWMACGKVALFGLTTAAMSFLFYEALARLPLGLAVTVEFVGPLGVAVAGSRRWLDLLWVALAAGGIILISPWSPLAGAHIDPLGVVFALLAGAFWAGYIVMSARVGQAIPGGAGLALALVVATVVLTPVGVASAGWALLDPRLLALGLVMALLSSAIPFSLELVALRSLPTRVFGVLMSMEPAVASLVGFIALGETLAPRSLVAIALVTLASVGSSRFHAWQRATA